MLAYGYVGLWVCWLMGMLAHGYVDFGFSLFFSRFFLFFSRFFLFFSGFLSFFQVKVRHNVYYFLYIYEPTMLTDT